MGAYHTNRTYDPKLDVRERGDLLEAVSHGKPNGILWPILGLRRSGKTWALKALENGLPAGSAAYLDLRAPEGLAAPPGKAVLLIDEPAGKIGKSATRLLDRLALLAQSAKVVVAMTPAEWFALLRAQKRPNYPLDPKDLRFNLRPLTEAEARRMARTKDAEQVFDVLPAEWKRSAFLLECLFETVERNPDLREALPALLTAVIASCQDAHVSYVKATFEDGLDEEQKAAVRAVARGEPIDQKRHDLLVQCGLFDRRGDQLVLADPVLADHLPPPLVIHHVSDVHIGPKAADLIDVKEKGGAGKLLGAAAGQAPVYVSYIEHVARLHEAGKAPHLLVVSGDLAETGSPDQLATACEWLEQLAKYLSDHPLIDSASPRLLLVGGNHDVDWGRALGAPNTRERHQPFAAAFAKHRRPTLEVDPEARTLAIARYPGFGIAVVLLGSAEFGGEPENDPDRAELLALVDQLRKRAAEEDDLNRADELRRRVARLDPGLVHARDLGRLRKEKWRLPLLVAVLHHPVSPLPATEVAKFAGLLNAGEVKDTLLAAGFCLVLHGHAHVGWFGREQWPGQHGDRTLHIASAPSLSSREVQEHHGFNEIRVCREGYRYEVRVTRFARRGNTWDPTNASMSFAVGGASGREDSRWD